MANALYPLYKQQLLNKEHNMSSDAIKAALISTASYTYSAAHSLFATDVPAGAKVAVMAAGLTSPTITTGTFNTASFSWTAVSGVVSQAIILWNDTPTTPTNKPLVAYYDTGMTGMPVTPNGGNINVTVNASGWFSL
jgi:hypothetical protein